MDDDEQTPIRVAYTRRNRDLDPQLIWRGKEEKNLSDLTVYVPPLYIQEKVQPKVLIDDLIQRTKQVKEASTSNAQETQPDLFADFNGISDQAKRTEFYEHDANWSNRMILGDSLQVMASLTEREGLRDKVQCIYIDPPYGISFNSNFQWSTTSKSVKSERPDHITREPEQVAAFRDTWQDGLHSYLSYMRDRLTVARELLADTGSIFVQIGDANVHRMRSLMDETFGEDNFVSLIAYKTSVPLGSTFVPGTLNFIIFYAKDRKQLKFRRLFLHKVPGEGAFTSLKLADGTIRSMSKSEREKKSPLPSDARVFFNLSMLSAGRTESCVYFANVQGRSYFPGGNKSWKTTETGMERLYKAGRLYPTKSTVRYILYYDDYPVRELTDSWMDTAAAADKRYVVQTSSEVIQRCILMTTDPGDLVLDPTCGSGTTAYVAEQWGRRWITIDTSRVAMALARARIMGASYPYYLLTDSLDGHKKQSEISGRSYSDTEFFHDIRQGFVYRRIPHVTLRSIANNADIDTIWSKYRVSLSSLLQDLNRLLNTTWKEWDVPNRVGSDWSNEAKRIHSKWVELNFARQREIDVSIATNADFEYLHDSPFEDKTKVRVAGPFTVESVSPHRMLAVDADDKFVHPWENTRLDCRAPTDFANMILENLRISGVQQSIKEDKISFSDVLPWPGEMICADGQYIDDEDDPKTHKHAAIMIGPEFGSVTRPDLVAAAKEAAEGGFDVMIACGFNFEAQASELSSLGRIPILKARMNADLHMADDLRNTGKGNLFVVFGEPDIDVFSSNSDDPEDDRIQVRVNGVDVFHPSTGEIRSDDADDIACWFIDTNYNEESFFVRHAYFLGAGDPYKALRTTLKAEVNSEAWESLHSTTSMPFDRPQSGRIAVKVINHLGDEVMKVFRVSRSS